MVLYNVVSTVSLCCLFLVCGSVFGFRTFCCWMIDDCCLHTIIWIVCWVVLYCVVSAASLFCLFLVCGFVFGPSAARCHSYCCWMIVGCCFHSIILIEWCVVLHCVVSAASMFYLFLVCGSIFGPSAAG